MSKNLKNELASSEFDYDFLPAEIAERMRAAAHRVRKCQHAAVIEIGRALLEVKDRLSHEQFVAWIEQDCNIPIWLGQQAMHAAELSVAAGLLAPAASAPNFAALDRELRRQPKPAEPEQRTRDNSWVVQREPHSNGQRARDQQEHREWGGEANLRQHHTVAAVKMLEQQLGPKLDKFLAAASKTDPRAIVDLLRDGSASRNSSSPPVRHHEDEPPLPFIPVSEQADRKSNPSSVAAAAPTRQYRSPEYILCADGGAPRLHLKYGEMRDRCLNALHDGAVIAAESVVMQLMRDRSLDPDHDQALRSDLLKRGLRALDALRREGRVEKIGKGRGVRWALMVPKK